MIVLRMNLPLTAGLAGLTCGAWMSLAQPLPTFEGAQWIWFSREPMPITTAQNFPGGAVYFRSALTLPTEG